MENIIVMFDSKDKILDMSLCEFMDIQVRSGVPFVVCNVSLEDYKELTKQVCMGYIQERMPRLDINRHPYANDRYIAGHGRGNKVILLADPDKKVSGKYLIVDGILRYSDEETITSEDIQSTFGKGLKIYTTLSIGDIINHYMLTNIDKMDVNELNREEVEMRLRAIYSQIYSLNVAKQKLLDRRDKIEKVESPGDYFIKYSK